MPKQMVMLFERARCLVLRSKFEAEPISGTCVTYAVSFRGKRGTEIHARNHEFGMELLYLAV